MYDIKENNLFFGLEYKYTTVKDFVPLAVKNCNQRIIFDVILLLLNRLKIRWLKLPSTCSFSRVIHQNLWKHIYSLLNIA